MFLKFSEYRELQTPSRGPAMEYNAKEMDSPSAYTGGPV